jgi:ABC-2 type transport system permease protein
MFLIATILAFILHFIIQYTFSMLAFWVERARSIESLWFFIFFFLSGIIAPLTVFPQSLAHVLFWTPLPYLVYVPAAVLVGLPVPVLQGIIVVIGWIIIITAVNRWCWHQGLKQYSGMGA